MGCWALQESETDCEMHYYHSGSRRKEGVQNRYYKQHYDEFDYKPIHFRADLGMNEMTFPERIRMKSLLSL